jgi:hypothetical protein
VLLSNESKAARSLGVGDEILMKVAAACISGRPFEDVFIQARAEVSDDPIHGVVPRTLGQMYDDGACSENKWDLVSISIWSLVSDVYARGGSLRWSALKDLAIMARQMGDHTRSYVYARMAAEKRPSDGTIWLIMAEAAIQANDLQAFDLALDRLRRLENEEKLRPVEQLVLDRLE